MFNNRKEQHLRKKIADKQLYDKYCNAYTLYLLNLYTLSNININDVLTTIYKCYKYASQNASFKYDVLLDYLKMLYFCKKNNILLNNEHNQSMLQLKNTCIFLTKEPGFISRKREFQRRIILIIKGLERLEKEKKEILYCTNEFSKLKIQ